jgi:hypothetical protein
MTTARRLRAGGTVRSGVTNRFRGSDPSGLPDLGVADFDPTARDGELRRGSGAPDQPAVSRLRGNPPRLTDPEHRTGSLWVLALPGILDSWPRWWSRCQTICSRRSTSNQNAAERPVAGCCASWRKNRCAVGPPTVSSEWPRSMFWTVRSPATGAGSLSRSRRTGPIGESLAPGLQRPAGQRGSRRRKPRRCSPTTRRQRRP